MPANPVVDPECAYVLRGHTAPVLNVRFTKNGAYCMSTSQDKSLILWNPVKGKAIRQYKKPHNHEVNDVSITSDNSQFVSCGGDKYAFLWDVLSGEVIRKFGGHNGKLYCCQFAADDTLLLTGCYDKAVRIFDLRTHQRSRPIQVLDDARDAVSSIGVTNDKRILTTSIDGSFRCYDLRMGKVQVDAFPVPLVGLGLSRDTRCYAVTCLDSSIHLVELDSGQHLNVYRGHKNTNYMLNAQICPDDAYIVSGSEDGRICIWDISAATNSPPLQELTPASTTLSKEAMSYTELREHDAAPAVTDGQTKMQNDWGCAFTIRFHPEQWCFLSCHNDRTLRLWKKPGEDMS